MDEFGAGLGAVSGKGSSRGDRSRGTSQPPSQSCAAAPNKQLLSVLKAEICQEIQVLNNVPNPSAGNVLLWHSPALDAFQARCIPCLPVECRDTGSDPSASFQPKHWMSPCHISIPKDLQRFTECRRLCLAQSRSRVDVMAPTQGHQSRAPWPPTSPAWLSHMLSSRIKE